MSREKEIRSAIIAWALENGILATNLIDGGGPGDSDAIPLTVEQATYFRTRKIVRLTVSEETKTTVFTIYSRLLIAKAKCDELTATFNAAFEEEKFRLRISESRPFKIDTSADDSPVPIRWHKDRIACGSSIGVGNQRNAGTFMALAKSKDDGDDELYGISCNHVVGGCNTARPGTPIVVPGILDVSTKNNQIHVVGDHDSTASMSQGLPSVFDISKNCDLACFRVRDPNQVSSMQGAGADAYDTPSVFTKPKKGMSVKKWGRSSGFTTGQISGINVEGESLPYDIISYFGPNLSQRFRGTVYFSEVIEVDPDQFDGFSKNGDSGALVVTNTPNQDEKIVGIVIGGDKRKSYLLPLKPALDELKLKLLNGHCI